MTTRAIVMGVLLGVVLATANVYMGLKTGFWETGGISASIVAFAILRRTGYSRDDTVISQATASAAASMPATLGILGAIPALGLLGYAASPWWLLPWGLACAAAGILAAVALRAQFLEREPLPFPGGVSTAEVITALHRFRSGAGGWAIGLAAALAAAVTWLRDGTPKLIPATLWLPGQLAGVPCEALTLGLSVSPTLVGVGFLVGLKSGIGFVVGAVLAWGIVAPRLLHAGIVAKAEYSALAGWLLWPGVALLLAGGLTSLAFHWQQIVRGVRGTRTLGRRSRALLLLLAVAIVVLAKILFGVHPAIGAAGVGLALVAAMVCIRVVGEAGLAPFGQMGQITQAIAPGPPIANTGAGAIVAGSIVQAAVAMEAFKTGQLLGVSPRAQTRAMLWGVVAGTLGALPVYLLITRAYGIGSEALPCPSAATWKAMAEVATAGTSGLPPGAITAAGVAIVAGIALEILGRTRRGRWLPSPAIVGIAFLIPAAASAAIAVGSLAAWAIGRRTSSAQMTTVAAGAIAGESLLGVVIAALIVSGVLS